MVGASTVRPLMLQVSAVDVIYSSTDRGGHRISDFELGISQSRIFANPHKFEHILDNVVSQIKIWFFWGGHQCPAKGFHFAQV